MPLLVSLVLSAILTPIFILIGRKGEFVDRPDGMLKPHSKAIPYMGGIAMFFSLLPTFWNHSQLLVMIAILTAVGFLDDVFNLSPKLRLSIELLTAIYVVLTFHNVIDTWLFLLILGVVVLINAVNMIDGMDGVCAGNIAISLVFFVILSSSGTSKEIALSLTGASLGFLIYNFPPAKIFMGDSGSYLLGISLSVVYLSSVKPIDFHSAVQYIFPLWIYLLDFTAGFLRRTLHKRNPMKGDRDHIYDKLKRRIGNVKMTTLSTYLINLSFSFLSILARFNTLSALLIAIFLSAILIKSLKMLGYD